MQSVMNISLSMTKNSSETHQQMKIFSSSDDISSDEQNFIIDEEFIINSSIDEDVLFR